MYENTSVKMKIEMGNIPLTIAQDAPQFGYPNQLSDQNNLSNGQFPPGPNPPIGFVGPTPVPGFAQQVLPSGPPPPFNPSYPQQVLPSGPPPYPQQPMGPTENFTPQVNPSLYPQIANQSQYPYPDVNMQQPAVNSSFQNLNPGAGTTAPTAPTF